MKQKESILSVVLLFSIFTTSCLFGFSSYPIVAQAAGSVTFLQFTGDATALSTHTFSSQNLGTPAPNRYIFVIVHGEEKAGSVSSVTVTIGGVSAVTDVFENDPTNGDIAAIARARVPSGTTGNIVVTTNDLTGIGIGVYRASGIGTPILKETSKDQNAAINLSVGTTGRGLVFAGASIDDDTSPITTTGVTEDYDSAIGVSTDRSAGGFIYPATGSAVSVSFDSAGGAEAAGVAASYDTGGGLTKPSNNLGLVGYWSFNEATSTIATDLSGSGNHGTLQNFASPQTSTSGWVSGKRGSALAFAGLSSDDRVNVGDINATDGVSTLTISMWIYDRNTAVGRGIVSKYAGATPGWDFYTSDTIDCGGDDITFSPDGNNGECTSGNVHQANRWEHWVVVYNGGQPDDDDDIKFYLNGVLQVDARQAGNDPVPDTTNSTSNVVSIGADSDLGAEFEGMIDEVRIYSRALSATEVSALYGAGATRIGTNSSVLSQGTSLASGLVGHWTFDGGDVVWGTNPVGMVYDKSGNNFFLNTSGISIFSAQTIGKLGQAFNFDGVNDWAACVDARCDSLDMGTSNWTATAWVKPDVASVGWIVGKQNFFGGGNPEAWNLSMSNTGRVAAGIRDDTASEVISTDDGTVLSTGVWQHVAVTFNRSGNMTRYLNGVQTGTADSITTVSSLVDNTNEFRIGARDATGDELPFKGAIDDVRVYNRVLSASEVKQLYLLGKSVIKQ